MPKSHRAFNKSTWPKADTDIEAALGRFIIAWNILEQQLDFAIQEISRLDYDLAHSITANLGTKAKLDIFHSMSHSLQDVFKVAVLETVDRLVADTSTASGNLRNFIVHGQPFQLQLEDGAIEIWAKFAARKGGVKGKCVRLSAAYADRETQSVKDLIERWIAIRKTLFEQVKILDLMDASEIGDE
jgi:hypothetical protein